jgi:DNA-binding NtrC family response regulator
LLISIVQSDPVLAEALAALVRHLDMDVRIQPSLIAVQQGLDAARPDCVLLSSTGPLGDLAGDLAALRTALPRLPVVAVSPENDATAAMALIRAGADDYLVEPVTPEHLTAALHQALALRRSMSGANLPAVAPRRGHSLVGESAVMRQLEEQIRKVAHSSVPVFISGESGVGKELVAHRIHEVSPRSDGPFVGLNCGALSDGLQDSELFGHEKGAFTGAIATHRGVFERASGGVVFLDEVAELRPETQVRLLRVLQNGELTRLGGERVVPVTARVVSATNKDIITEVREGRFREDLFYRMVVYPIRVPPLRDRLEDLPALLAHFLKRYGTPAPGDVCGITEAAIERLQQFGWPGNVRDLEYAVRLALVNAENRIIDSEHLPDWVLHPTGLGLQVPAGLPSSGLSGGFAAAFAPSPAPDGLEPDLPEGPGILKLAEREAIISALVATQGRVAFAARRLGLSRATLYRRIQHYGLCTEEFREPTERMQAPLES